MTGLQQWIEQNYPDKENTKEIDLNYGNINELKEIDGKELTLKDYPNLEELVVPGYFLKTLLTKLDVAYNAKLTKLECCDNELSSLDLSHNPQLTELDCSCNEQLISFSLGQNNSLEKLVCNQSGLTTLDFLQQLINPEKLTHLDLRSNNIHPTTLEIFSRFMNLKSLEIGNNFIDLDEEEKNTYNRFSGSLEPLKNLSRLETLNIEETDIDSGLEYLSENIKYFYCGFVEDKPQGKVKAIIQELEKIEKAQPGSEVFTSSKLLSLWKKNNLTEKLELEAKQSKEEQSQQEELLLQIHHKDSFK